MGALKQEKYVNAAIQEKQQKIQTRTYAFHLKTLIKM